LQVSGWSLILLIKNDNITYTSEGMPANWNYSKHAIERMEARSISKEEIELVIRNPDSVIEEPCKKIYQKKIILEDTLDIYRAYLNDCKKSPLVITVYRSTKIDKYEI